MANEQWHYSRGDNHQAGPVSSKELNRLAESGELRLDDLVWKDGMEDWVPASRVKGLEFSASAANSEKKAASKKFDSQAFQATMQDAQKHADEAAKRFWFFDLKFNQFVAASIIRVIWAVYLIIGVSSMVIGIVGSIFQYPIFNALLYSGAMLVGFFVLTLMIRVWLEVFMLLFRISEHLRDIKLSLSQK